MSTKYAQAEIERITSRYVPRYITVWIFRSVDGKQVVRKVRPLHPDDQAFVHEYQQIEYRGIEEGYEARQAVRP